LAVSANSGIIDRVHDKTANLRLAANGPPGVAILVPDGVTLFELGVASDVFGTDITTDSGRPLYRRYICGAAPSAMTDAGFRMEVPYGLEVLEAAQTVVVLPAVDPDRLPDTVPQALRLARSRGQRILSLCTGAFVLAAAGLLDGHVATTHWSECAELARRYPRVRVDPGVLYVDEGDLLTSAGSAASVDLCLHIVERDYGAEIAARVARDLVVPLYRSGGQAQYIESPVRVPDNGDLFADTMEWLTTHLAETVTVADLAERSAMSARTFARRFLASTGTTPLAWLTWERLRFAKRLLETSDAPVDVVARESGFGSPDNLRKHFARTLRTTPQAYRRTFRAKSAA
jgi:AraC family transcriptional regulator, transcriptional activator FtrA